MLDMYDFENDIWLCHSFGGRCYNYTAFVSATLMCSSLSVCCLYDRANFLELT